MKRISVKKLGLAVAAMVLFVIVLIVGFVLKEITDLTPSDDVVKREFLTRYPHSTISQIELIFEQDGGAVYLVTAREYQSAEEGKYDFALKRVNGSWEWCNDQTDNPCGPIGK